MTLNPDKHISKVCDAGRPVAGINLLLDVKFFIFNFINKQAKYERSTQIGFTRKSEMLFT